ncbi:MAG TPA: lysophospholipid acyltransferase family protein [Gemmatimonadaceae bacterium]|nr:lysophospholipid acyltransferase family protein [Gemmatimonadaceae bacterium]
MHTRGWPHHPTPPDDRVLYAFIRFLAGIALDWFYRDLTIEGADRIPRSGPLLIAVNHPNQLIDAMVLLRLAPRRVRMTGKATLFEHPVLAAVLRWYGVVPLRRVRDETPSGAAAPDPSRNREAFRELVDTLADGGAVLIFPEGTSHHAPQLAPLRTGLARVALQARIERQLHGLRIQPVGLIFERKWAPRTRILARVGEPLDLDAWCAVHEETSNGDGAVDLLTADLDARLRALTLNFATVAEAEQVLGLARVLSGVFDARLRSLGEGGPPLTDEARIASRIAEIGATLRAREPERVADFLGRLESFRVTLDVRDIPVTELRITPDFSSGARFAVRELLLVALVGPLAWWGRINHWLPLTLAQALARRTSRTPEDPAMHTVLAGAGLVLLAYAAQTTLVALLAGPWWALAYLASLPFAASIDLRLRDRLRHARDRVRTYFVFRREPRLHERLRAELQWLREEAIALDRMGRALREAERQG